MPTMARNSLSSPSFAADLAFPINSSKYKAKLIDAKQHKQANHPRAAGLAKAPILAFLVEKPPVPMVAKAWVTESNQSIPAV